MTTHTIKTLQARQILDSRGNPTIEVDVTTQSGITGRASVPSGASTGKREAIEKRDQDPTLYGGKSVHQAIKAVHADLQTAVRGLPVTDQNQIDNALIQCDNSPEKSRLGANALLGVSLATARAAAQTQSQSLYVYLSTLHQTQSLRLPVPMMNILNGGAHANNKLSLQEFMIIPTRANRFSEALHQGWSVFNQLKKLLNKHNLSTTVGDEGGFAPMINSHTDALTWLMRAIEAAGYTPGKDISIALDSAASEFYDADKQRYTFLTGETFTSEALIDYYGNLMRQFPIVSLEDGLDESDWSGWLSLTNQYGKTVQLVGDDLFVTNPALLTQGIAAKRATAILIKPNQIGTLTETLKTIQIAQDHNYGVIISHRSGETEDTFIADLAVATGAGQIKTGSLSRTDRVAKYNQLLRIESELGDHAHY